MKKALYTFAALIISTMMVGFFSPASVITVKGSDTMVQLCQRWAEKYMKLNPNIRIQVTGGGSGTGISALINGTTDICASSRPMKDAEKVKLRSRYGTTGIEIRTAKDGLAVYLNESNPVKELSFEQIKGVYTGTVTNWKQLGGKDEDIILYGRENNSGTYVFFEDNVLGGADFASNTQTLPGTAAVVNAVKKDPNGIGYGGAGYAKGIKECAVRKGNSGTAYLPTAANVASGVYPVTRYLYFYLREKPNGDMKEFLKWVVGDDGQKIVTNEGFFPIK